jgi:cobalt-zinc-cadmium efflux system membrane fusion protein
MKNDVLVFLLLPILFHGYGCADGETVSAEIATAGADRESDAENDRMIRITYEQFEMGGMAIGSPAQALFSSTIQVNGYIDVPPRNKAAISVYYGGYVKGLDLLPGQSVRKGQVLFRLENPDFVQMQQDYLETRAQLDYLKNDFERQQTLAAENIASQKDFLKAASDYEVQQARSEGLRKKLEMLNIDLEKVEARDFVSGIQIYAPISGIITKINVSSGSYLNTSDIPVVITNPDHLHLELDVFEKDLHLVNKGQKIIFRVPGSGNMSNTARVHLIGGVVEGKNRTVRVHGHLEKEANEKGLLPGMFVEAEIETAADSVLALPETAIVSVEEASFVLIQKEKDDKGYLFERRRVQTGRTSNGMTEIMDAPFPEEPVLINGAFNLIAE